MGLPGGQAQRELAALPTCSKNPLNSTQCQGGGAGGEVGGRIGMLGDRNRKEVGRDTGGNEGNTQ